jgi:basic amino acid/polyamine antiporter, APA family
MEIAQVNNQSGPIKPQLRTIDLTFIVIGLVIGMGIFRTPAEVAQRAGDTGIFFAAWALGAAISAIGALTFAEIGTRLPVAGGFYRIFSVCYHPVFAFMVNWIMVISNAVSTSAVAIIGAEYMAPVLFPDAESNDSVKWIAVTSVLILYVVNLSGIRISSKTINFLMVIKLTLLFGIIISPLVVDINPVEAASVTDQENSHSFFKSFLLCFIPVFFTYGGYQQTMNFGGDVQQPNKAIPRAILFGISIILIFYLLVNFAYVRVLGFEGLKQSTTLASDMWRLLIGPRSGDLVSVLMFFSVMAFVNVSLISNPRVYFAMAEDGVMPPVFKRINQRTQVQFAGVTFFCVIIIVVLLFLPSFQRLLGFVMFFDSISIIAAVAAIFIFRNSVKKHTTEMQPVFKMHGYPVLPVIFILVYAGVSVAIMWSDPSVFFTGMLMFLAGYPLFYLVKRIVNKTE